MALQRRLQLVLDDDLYRRLLALSQERERSMSGLIREALDTVYPDRAQAKRTAGDFILAAEPMELPPDPVDLRRELDEAHAGGL